MISDWIWRQRTRQYFARHQRRYWLLELVASLLGMDAIDEEGEPMPEHYLSANVPQPKETP